MQARFLVFVFACVSGVATAQSSPNASLYEPGFTFTLKGADARLDIVDATGLGSMVFMQLGKEYISAVNVETGLERWRFTSKSGSIRRMELRGAILLVEAEQLYALNTASGEEQWQFPLNCFSETSCNARVRHKSGDIIVLSGFDGRDDKLMLVNAKTGARLWPNWVDVATAKHVVITPSTLVVATAKAPYAVVGLNRFTGRARWTFRPEGTETSAAGLESDGKIVTTWWSSRSADTVYSVDIESGQRLGEWMVARRPRLKETRGGGPGFFFAYQPSVLGGGGSIRAWDNRSGEKLWRHSIRTPRVPSLLGSYVQYWTQAKSKVSLVSLNGLSGEEVWHYERRQVKTFESSLAPGHLVIRMSGEHVAVVVLDITSGKVVAIGSMNGTTLTLGRLRLSGRYLFAVHRQELIRLEPKPALALVAEFDQLVNTGDMKGASKLHKRILPFVDDLSAAAEIHRKVRSQTFRRESARMARGGLPALLPYMITSSTDAKMLFYEDFKTFLTNVLGLLKPIRMPDSVSGTERERLGAATQRIVELVDRFERKLNKSEDKEMYGLLRDVVIPLAELMGRSEKSQEAAICLHSLYKRSWMVRTPALTQAVKNVALEECRRFEPQVLAAAKGKANGPEILEQMKTIHGFELLKLPVPTPEKATTRMGMSEFLLALRERLP